MSYPFTAADASFSYDGVAQRIRAGVDEIDQLGRHLDGFGATRVLVVCGPSILEHSDVVHRVESVVGDRLVGRFGDVAPHAPLDVLADAHDYAQGIEADTIISVGGGSTLAIAKGVALLASTDHDILEFQTRFEPPDRVIAPSVPFPEIRMGVVAVPTTMGGAEIGRAVGGFTDHSRHEKVGIGGNGGTSPRVVIVDGRALATTPTEIQRSTAVGQLRVAIETFAASCHHPVGDALALHAVRLLGAAMAGEWPRDPEGLLRVKNAAMLASMASVVVGPMGVNSAIAHQLGAVCDVPHGDANAIMLPHTIRFNATTVGSRLRLLTGALGLATSPTDLPGELGEQLALYVATLLTRLDLPSRLRDVHIDRGALPGVAAAALRDQSLSTNPRPVRASDELLALLEQAW